MVHAACSRATVSGRLPLLMSCASLAGLVQTRTNGLLWMMDTISASWLIREATHCSVWPASGPPGPPPGTGTATVWVHW